MCDLTDICTSETGAHVVSLVGASGVEQLIAALASENTEQALLLAVLDALRKTFEVGQGFPNHKEFQKFQTNVVAIDLHL